MISATSECDSEQWQKMEERMGRMGRMGEVSVCGFMMTILILIYSIHFYSIKTVCCHSI